MVARSSDSKSEATIIFYRCFLFLSFFLSLTALPQTSEIRHSRDFPTRRDVQQNLCHTDFFKVPLKRTGAENPKICTIFLAKSQTISAVVR